MRPEPEEMMQDTVEDPNPGDTKSRHEQTPQLTLEDMHCLQEELSTPCIRTV